jgi:hypothetical protein
MKNKLFLLFVIPAVISCSAAQDEQQEDQLSEKAYTEQARDYESAPAVSDEYYDTLSDFSSMEKRKSDAPLEMVQSKPVTMKQALENLSDTIYLKNVRLSKKFIKTADFRFKVKN